MRVSGRALLLLATIAFLTPAVVSTVLPPARDAVGEPVARAVSRSEALLRRADFDAALAALQAAGRDRLDSLTPADRVALASQEARVRVIRDALRQRPAGHRETLDRLISVQMSALGLPSSPVRARYLYALATAHLFNGNHEASLGQCRRARKMFRKVGDDYGEADARAFILMMRQGELRRAGDDRRMIALIPRFEQEIAFAAQAGNLLALAYNQRHLARIHLEQMHDPNSALILFRDALASRVEAGFQPYLPPSYLSMGDAYLAGDDPGNAMAMWRRAMETADEVGFVRHRVLARFRLADLQRDLGEGLQAGNLAREALHIATEAEFTSGIEDATRRLEALASPPGGAENGRLVRLTFHQADDRYPAWSPRSGDLAFESRRDGNWNIYLRETDGTVRRLTDHVADDRYPAWHPKGTYIAFQSDRSGSAQLHLLSLDSGKLSQLTDVKGEPMFPDWSPDGSTIAFTLRRGKRDDLYTIEVGTRLLQRLTDHPARDVGPRWSPDGRQLAFFSRRDADGKDDEIYLYTFGSGTIRRLTEQPGHDFSPAWSPTGDHLAAARITGDNRRWIEVLDLEGSEVARIDDRLLRATEPCWAPDGSEIAFAARRDGAYDIYLFSRKP